MEKKFLESQNTIQGLPQFDSERHFFLDELTILQQHVAPETEVSLKYPSRRNE